MDKKVNDYHVGILKGFLIGREAPDYIMHALKSLVDSGSFNSGAPNNYIGASEESEERIKPIFEKKEQIDSKGRKLPSDTEPVEKPEIVADKKTTGKGTRRPWVLDDLIKLKKMVDQGVSMQEIAVILNRGVSGCYSKHNNIDLAIAVAQNKGGHLPREKEDCMASIGDESKIMKSVDFS